VALVGRRETGDGRRETEEGRGKREEGRGKREEGRGKREEGVTAERQRAGVIPSVASVSERRRGIAIIPTEG
jgi:hypothetical protein